MTPYQAKARLKRAARLTDLRRQGLYARGCIGCLSGIVRAPGSDYCARCIKRDAAPGTWLGSRG